MNIQKEDAVGEAGERVDFAVAVGESCVRAPFAHYCCGETDGETRAVEEHVDTIC